MVVDCNIKGQVDTMRVLSVCMYIYLSRKTCVILMYVYRMPLHLPASMKKRSVGYVMGVGC